MCIRDRYKIDLNIESVQVLQKRSDSSEACDKRLYDEDAVWIRNAIKLLNCTPAFLENIIDSKFEKDKDMPRNNSCSKIKLLEFHSKHSPESNFESISNSYDQPCTEMESVISSTATSLSYQADSLFSGGLFSTWSRLSRLKIKLRYNVKHYNLATNEKSFTMWSLWSQIGGFIGIFLGYSLLQLPALVGYVIKKFLACVTKPTVVNEPANIA